MAIEDRKIREQNGKRNAILRASRKLFFEKGFRKVTVEHIARRAEISKGSIYLHFTSKEEIYTQLLLTEIDKFHKKTEDVISRCSCASEAIQAFARIYLDFFLADGELFRILMNFMLHPENSELTPELRNRIRKSTNRTIKVIENMIQDGVEQGELPASVDVIQCRNAIWGLCNGVVSLHLFSGEEQKRKEKIVSTVEMGLSVLIRGLAATPKRESNIMTTS